jgi:hypothetical protein
LDGNPQCSTSAKQSIQRPNDKFIASKKRISNVAEDRPAAATDQQPLSENNATLLECASTHSDDNSILSPMEATDSVMRTIYGDKAANESWPSWNGSNSGSPVRESEKPLLPNDSSAVISGNVTPAQNSVVDPHDIGLNENDFDPKKSAKPSAMKDPTTGLTVDTVKRRRLCSRYDRMLAGNGIAHRLMEVNLHLDVNKY